MPAGDSAGSLPLVTIVTPSYNAAPFLRRTIESVLSQDYQRIEYIVMDGGSSDGTVEILRSYGSRLRYVSAPDGGAADAINQGFLMSEGSIFAWLNADDTYTPGAISCAVRHMNAAAGADVIYGEGVWIDENDVTLGRYPTESPFSQAALERECIICQPAAWVRRSAFANAGMLDARLSCSFDYDLWIRLSRRCSFLAVPDLLARSRMHLTNKSLGQRKTALTETIGLMRRHFGYVPVNWVFGYLSYLRDGRDQFFETTTPSPGVYLASLPVGSYYNWQKLGRYWREWFSRVTARNLGQMTKARIPWQGASRGNDPPEGSTGSH